MRQTKNIQWGEGDLTLQELTMQELATVLDNVAHDADQLDLIFDGRLPSQAVVLSSGLARDALHQLTPSRLDVLWSAAEAVNPFFHKAVQRIVQGGRKTLTAQATP